MAAGRKEDFNKQWFISATSNSGRGVAAPRFFYLNYLLVTCMVVKCSCYIPTRCFYIGRYVRMNVHMVNEEATT